MAPLLLSMVGLLLLTASGAAARPVTVNSVKYVVTNEALPTLGGKRFESEVGTDFTVKVLRNATAFAWKVFRQSPNERKQDVDVINLFVRVVPGIAFTVGNNITIGDDYVEKVPSVRVSITETYFHEVAHVWQPFGEGQPIGLIEGIADYVVLKAGLGTWAKPGKGTRWDQGYDATALFLDYCASFRSTFVADLIRLMPVKYSDSYFEQLLGKTVDQLWADYKAKYGDGQ
ncbi:hypothetical protein Taro_015043 [Colocasia esculenta]|uniref:Basic secretory peptidase family protein n=1 Tax=Colocasia esculenta TaxID=4460 RepID=A0A843US01_COLES|nr:hypothetical protein [Colocasia esculenta]